VDEIEQSVDAARQRLVIRQWAGRLAVCLTGAFCIALAAILAPKLFVLPHLPAQWAVLWLGGAAIAGVVAASIWTALRSKTRLEAAVEIDQRYNLRERIASSLTLTEEDLATPAGAALLRDAQRAIAKVEVGERFKLGLDRGVWRPVAPAVAALLIATFVGNRTAQATAEAPPTEQIAAAEAKKAAEEARKQIEKRRKEADEKGLADASALLKKVEEETAKLAKSEAKDPTKAAVKLNDLSKELAERRDKLGGGDELRNQLNRMKDIGKGPADKAADAMKQGDWQKAMQEIAKVREEIASGDISPEKKEQLAAQLGKMQQQLGDAAQQHEQQKQELERQLAEAQRKGDLNQAGKLQQKIDQLAQKQPQMERLQQLAQQMQQAKEAMEAGDPQQAAEAMKQMAQQMDQMAREDGEMEMLDAAMADIMGAKEAMGMEAGDKAGQMAGDMPGMGNQQGKGQNKDGAANGRGRGRGRGDGSRNTEKDEVSYRDTQVRQDVGRGSSTFGGLVDGPTVKGDVVESIKTPLDAAAAQPADPLTSERLPRSRREHAEEYFRGLREKL
jgi:hypothetical protein